ncbi:MAG TPA: CHASE2 domain-containing protein, partial [Candidatus Binataceae bacterium]|nr:CHASE2 domain-containing protein [Candidatus Binataceae bacterium]
DDCPLVSYGKAGLTWTGNCPAPYIPNYSLAQVLPILAGAAKGVGTVNIVADADQIVRRIALFVREGDTLFPALAAEAVRLQRGEHDYVIESANGTGEPSFGEQTGINYVDIADLRIPTDANGQLTLKYRHTNPAAFVSATAVLGGAVPATQIAHKIIFIGLGATSAGLVDLHPTPIDAAVPGVEIMEQAAENILGGTELQRPSYIIAVEELIVLAITLVLAVAMPRVAARWLIILSGSLLLLVVGGGWAAYNYASFLIDPVYPVLVLVTFVAVVTFHIYRYSELQRGRVRRAFELPRPDIEQ